MDEAQNNVKMSQLTYNEDHLFYHHPKAIMGMEVSHDTILKDDQASINFSRDESFQENSNVPDNSNQDSEMI